ncbi:MAG: hypothetical protein V2I33_23485, partial [Kangiellaceae bacterium]|nr:hypothetical protein [Kangiellaceae bacterium]
MVVIERLRSLRLTSSKLGRLETLILILEQFWRWNKTRAFLRLKKLAADLLRDSLSATKTRHEYTCLQTLSSIFEKGIKLAHFNRYKAAVFRRQLVSQY